MNGKLRLLILEDSADDAHLLVRKLAKEGGYAPDFQQVETLGAFRTALESSDWDIIVSDHSMPSFDAITALRELAQRKMDIPLIIVSGTIRSDDAIAAMKAGAADFIMKDDLSRLLPAIARELREARSRREKRETELKLQQAQKMDSIGRLAGGIAHDFNNILTGISGYCHFVLQALKPGDPVRDDVEQIKLAGERAAALTRQLLAFSRQQVLQPKVLDLNVLVAGMEKMLRRIVGEQMEVVSSLSERLGRVNADPGQIEQVLLNLIVNARDAMPRGGKITVETANVDLGEEYARTHPEVKPGPHVMLSVGDKGTGMAPEVYSRLFEPFFTTKEPGKGTGLGLATVYGIVKQSGGSISVQSELGAGSVFKVYLPAVQSAADETAPEAAPSSDVRGSETILLAEDDEVLRKILIRLLSGSGYTVLAAASGEAALETARRHRGPIHLLLTDIIMTGMRGDDLVHRLLPLRPGTKVIFMSGYTEAGVVRHSLLSSESAFAQKPVDPPVLVRLVRDILDKPKAPPP
jgi:signal transduction histidine kinase